LDRPAKDPLEARSLGHLVGAVVKVGAGEPRARGPRPPVRRIVTLALRDPAGNFVDERLGCGGMSVALGGGAVEPSTHQDLFR
jgi:hypothetical protein